MPIKIRYVSYERDGQERSKMIAEGEIAPWEPGSKFRDGSEENLDLIFPVPVTVETLKFNCGDKVTLSSLTVGRVEFIDQEAPANLSAQHLLHLLRGLNLYPNAGAIFRLRSKSSAAEKIAIEIDGVDVAGNRS